MSGPAYHGRTHNFGGTDPIPDMPTDAIEFDKDNQGGYLYVTTNDEGPTDTFSGTPLGLLFINSTQNGLRIRNVYSGNTAQIGMTNGLNIALTADGSLQMTRGTGGRVLVDDDGVTVTIAAGQKFAVQVPTIGNALEVWDDGSVHILTGMTITADL